MHTIYTYNHDRLEQKEGAVVEEYPLVMQVNGRELATLVASPHDLRYLAAGFLRLQGFVERVEDFHLLSVCSDFGIANVRIKGEIPERLKPVLTSGCGTGITYTLENRAKKGVARNVEAKLRPEAVCRLMEALFRKADNYRNHGGIHSAAVGDAEGNLILWAEDIGRHNTLDRIAGEALLKRIELAGTVLVTSGRISAEMAAKAASLGMALIASRTSPTDMAIKMCQESGICLIGYLKGGKFNVYAHPEHLAATVSGQGVHPADGRIPGVTGVILAGGKSSRMGSNKALLPYKGGRFIEAIHRQLAEIFSEVILVTNNPEHYDFLPCRKVPDLFPGMGVLAGIHSALSHSSNSQIFVVACDMPHLDSSLIRHIAAWPGKEDVVIPKSSEGLEPLHARYGKTCLGAVEEALLNGEKRIVSFFSRISVAALPEEVTGRFDPAFASFSNINTPDDYYRLRGEEKPLPAEETFVGKLRA